jgi:hypothetical protein
VLEHKTKPRVYSRKGVEGKRPQNKAKRIATFIPNILAIKDEYSPSKEEV